MFFKHVKLDSQVCSQENSQWNFSFPFCREISNEWKGTL